MKKLAIKIIAAAVALTLILSMAACTGQAGKSAYEIARDNGFTGSEQEWLASLSGTDGRDGKDAEAFDIYTLFDAYLETYTDATFEEFLQSFLVADYYDVEYAAARAVQSIVSIRSRFKSQSGGFRPTVTTYYAAGSGVVYKSSGEDFYIITNYHVVYDYTSITENHIADEILVYSYGGGSFTEAEFIGGSVSKDIAIIKASSAELQEYLKPAVVTDSGNLTLGSRAIVAGNPLNEGIAVTSGIISVDSEEIEMEALDAPSNTVYMRVIRTDTPINSGNSGGGMFNTRGELIGIVNAKTVSSGVESMGYAIPSNVAKGIADCVIENASKKCVLGIVVTATEFNIEYDSQISSITLAQKLEVTEITAGSLADGKLLTGDILLSALIGSSGEISLTRSFHLSDFLYKARVGDTLYLTVLRGGTETEVSLTIGSGNFTSV